MTDQSTETIIENNDAGLPTITIRDDTAAYLTGFDPQKFYDANTSKTDDLFNQFAALVGEDPTKPARTIGLLSYLSYLRAKQSFDLTTSIALLAGAHASYNAGQQHNHILRLAYVMQEIAEGRKPFANLVARNEDEASFVEGLRQASGVRIVGADSASETGGDKVPANEGQSREFESVGVHG